MLSRSDVLHAEWNVLMLRPCFYVAVVPAQRAVLLSVRGTKSVADALTDIAAATEPLRLGDVAGHAHRGIWRAASWLREHALPHVRRGLAANPGFAFVIGAGGGRLQGAGW